MTTVLTLAAVLLWSQTQPSFEAAVVKPNKSGMRGYSLPPPRNGRFTATNAPLRELIVEAYQIQESQLAGGPSWINSEGFDVTAKSAGPAKRTEMYTMLQALLAERFGLVLHRETKEMPVYAITVAKSGPKMPKEGDEECGEPSREHPCGGFNVRNRRQVYGERVSIPQLAMVLSALAGRMVVDKTGLAGNFDIKLEWTPDEGQLRGNESPNAPPTPESNGPSLFTAMQEQLGLKLESQRAQVEILVIDRVERPGA